MPTNSRKQALTLLRRRFHARRIGVNFKRWRGWKAPPGIRTDGQMRPLLVPNAPGSDYAFLDILIDDCCGICRCNQPIEHIIDIGGHSGFFSLHAKMLYPKAVVRSYEPNPAMARYIDFQSKTGGFQWFPEAVGETDGRAELISVVTELGFKILLLEADVLDYGRLWAQR